MPHAPLTRASGWHGAPMARSTRWTRELSPAMLDEIEAALRRVQRRGLAWNAVTRDDFPLPGLAAFFDDVHAELEDGSGMVKLRGFPVARYAEDQLRTIWFGLGVNLG